MELPLKDTPTVQLISRGYGDEPDTAAVVDTMQLLRVSKKLLGHFYKRFDELNISPGKYSVLMELLLIEAEEGVMPSVLAERIGVSRPTVTGLIEGLRKQGYVQREASQGDRRQVTVRLSPSGVEFMNEMLPGQFDAMAGILDGLSERRRVQFRGALEVIEGNLK